MFTHAQLCPALCDLKDCSPLGSSVGFSRQECWSGLPCPAPGDFADTGIKPTSLASLGLAVGFFTTELPDEAHFWPK